ncbi:MAG: MarR family transcriptional regulator [Chloroflexota bacterium]
MERSDAGPENRVLLEERALSLDTRVFMMLTSGPDDPMLTLDLSMPQLKVLLLVERLTAPSMGDLAHILGVGQSAISGLVDRLSDQGLVRREEDALDRRVVRVYGSEACHDLVQRIRLAGAGRLKRVIARLTDEELLHVVSAMEILHRTATDVVASQEASVRHPIGSRG